MTKQNKREIVAIMRAIRTKAPEPAEQTKHRLSSKEKKVLECVLEEKKKEFQPALDYLAER